MKKPFGLFSLVSLSLLLLAVFFGCQANVPVSSPSLPPEVSIQSGDTYHEVDCLLPGQVRKLGTMVYAGPRRPLRTTAGDCEIRGGEYVAYDRANYGEALTVWMVAAEAGDPIVEVYVGKIHVKSPADKPRYNLATTWFEKAAASGNKRAQVNLGYLYENGLGVAADTNQAVRWYSKASGANVQEIVQQQQQLTAQEKAEITELKAQNGAQITELQRLKKEMGAAETSLASGRKKLDKRNGAIVVQQQEIVGKQEEVKKVAQQLAARKVAVASDLERKHGDLERSLKVKEQQLSEQKRLAAELSGQLKKQQNDEKQYKATLAALNGKMANLPGSKITVFDPQLLRTRIVVASMDKGRSQRAINGQVWSHAGLQYLKINDRDTEFKGGGKFRAAFLINADEMKVQIVATDFNGKKDEMFFTAAAA